MAAAVAQQTPFVTINGQNFGMPLNPKANWAPLELIVDFCKSANGAFRSFQLLEKTSKVASLVLKAMDNSTSSFFDEMAGRFTVAWTMLTFPRLPEVTKKAKEAVVEWLNPPTARGLDRKRDNLQKVHDLADAAAAYGYAGSLVFGSMFLKNVADVPDLVTNITDFQMAIEDKGLAEQSIDMIPAQNPQNEAVRQRFLDTKYHAMIKMAKAAASIVTGVLGLMVLALGGPIVPASILLAISFFSTIAAVGAHFYKETRTYDLVDCSKIRQPEVFVASR